MDAMNHKRTALVVVVSGKLSAWCHQRGRIGEPARLTRLLACRVVNKLQRILFLIHILIDLIYYVLNMHQLFGARVRTPTLQHIHSRLRKRRWHRFCDLSPFSFVHDLHDIISGWLSHGSST